MSQATMCRGRSRVALWEEGERGGDEEKVDPGEGLGERMGPIFPGATMHAFFGSCTSVVRFLFEA